VNLRHFAHMGLWGCLGLGWLPAWACFELAASRYEVPVQLLRAIAQVESGFNPRALNLNANGTHDIGLMQINSSWLPQLRQMSVSEQALWDPCVNTLVAAWLLSENFKRWGLTYKALGAYHSPDAERQLRYAKRVLRAAASGPLPQIQVPKWHAR